MSLESWTLLGRRAVANETEANARSVEMLQWVLAGLRAQYWNYQESHWQVRGTSFYGDHLLFQRLYESVTDQVDALAEKIVASFGVDAVSTRVLHPKFDQWLAQWSNTSCLHMRGLQSEEAIQEAIRRAYARLKELGTLTLGMDDFLMATASEHETNEYLLKQVLRTKEAAPAWAALEG
jgi:DNA-binding ferritin-like protein